MISWFDASPAAMPLHPQAERFLRTWNALGLPSMETQPVEDTRRLLGQSGCGPQPGCPELAAVEDRFIAGPGGPLRIRLYSPKECVSRGIGLYFHGGGWVLNSVDTHDDVCRRLTHASGNKFVSVDYRLAPEDPYPAALDDAIASLRWVVDAAAELDIDPACIAVAGDSAGANLAAALCQQTRDQGGPTIAQQTLIYPITDCDLTRPSYVQNADGYFLTTSQMRWFWDQYCPDQTRRSEPYASPIRGRLEQLPPTLLYTAEYDPLCDEGRAYAEALAVAGNRVTHRHFPGLIHAFVRRYESFDAAKEVIREVGECLRTMFAK
jgi:acetyl esterase